MNSAQLTKTDISFFKRMVLGYVNIMRQNGAFDDRAFDIYSGHRAVL